MGLYQNIKLTFGKRIKYQNPPPTPLQRGKNSVQKIKFKTLIGSIFQNSSFDTTSFC